MTPRREPRTLTAIFWVILLGVWVAFAPTMLGGDVTYVILTGNSMLPDFRLGDLVLVREQPYYRIGDIVAYRHPDIGLVFHRIVGQDEAGRFVLRGDHNGWQDSYHPTEGEIVGRFWLRWPGAGNWLRKMRSPLWMALLSLAISGLFLMSFSEQTNKKTMRASSGRLDALFFWFVLSLAGGLLALVAFRTPETVAVPQQITYRQRADFAYRARTTPGVYDEAQLRAGDPIFRQLNETFTVQAQYQLQAESDVTAQGTYRLLAQIRDDTGWKRTMVLVPETSFSEPMFTVEGIVNLEQAQTYIDVLEEKTGFRANRYYLDVILEVQVTGQLDARPFSASFSPTLRFQYTPLAVYLYEDPFASGNPLSAVQEGLVRYEEKQPNALHILGVTIPVPVARALGLAIALPSLAVLFWLGADLYRASRRSELERIFLLHGHQIVQTRDVRFSDTLQPVEVASFTDLAAIAEQQGRPIVHLPDGSLHHFFVQTEMQLYHYRMADVAPAEIEALEGPVVSRLPAWLQPKRYRRLQEAYHQAMQTLAEMIDRRIYDEGHARRVAELARDLAVTMGLSERAAEEIYRAAYLHDLGLAEVPEDVLLKEQPLDEAELELVRSHPHRLPAALTQLPDWKSLYPIIYYHHERWDGSGYPENLSGEAIPLGARIVAVADVWDALLHPRPYRDAWSEDETLEYFCDQRGQLFDPAVVDALCTLKGRRPLVAQGISEAEEAQDEAAT